MGENLRKIIFSPLPRLSRKTPPRYYFLWSPQVATILGSSTQNMVTQDLVQSSTPISPNQNSPSVSTSPIVSTPGGHSPAQVALPTGGTISSMG